jgi:dTDP-glucose pyrophosphorylase/CBS domain-containing protein
VAESPNSSNTESDAVKSVQVTIRPDATLIAALNQIDRVGKGIIIVVDDNDRFLGTITDGDIRRGILAGLGTDHPIAGILETKNTSYPMSPTTAPIGTPSDHLIRLMRQNGVRQIPLLDSEQRVAGLVTLEELLPEVWPTAQAVIMAGGFGTRLRPYTDNLPKPMLPVGDQPLMELTVRQLQSAGIRHVNISTHYLADKIIDHFGDGSEFGVEFKYLHEDQPLGTAGALKLMAPPQERFLVINGDILTRIDYRTLLAYHVEQKAVLTVGVRKYEFKVPYGVVETDGPFIRQLVEKPSMKFFVNAGIYVLEPSVYELIPTDRRFDMTELINLLLERGLPVISFPILEYWLDIGQQPDYEKAQQDMQSGRYAA